MRFARAARIGAFGLFSLCRSAAAQTAATKTLVEVDGHKLNVRVSGSAKPGVPTDAGTPPNAWARQKIALVITSLVKARVAPAPQS